MTTRTNTRMRVGAIRVLSVDDHAFVAEGLAARIGVERDLEWAGRAEDATDLVNAVDQAAATIVLLDIDMPGADTFEAMQDLRRRRPDVRAIILSAHVRDRYIDEAFDHGAWGYFSKGDPPETVIDGIRRVAAGAYAYGPLVQQRLEEMAAGTNAKPTSGAHAEPKTRLQSLTKRELEVLRLIGKGMTRADIAQALHRSPKTIDSHHTAIMKKLDIHDRVEVARYAIAEGLADC